MRGGGVETLHTRGKTWYCLLQSENTVRGRFSLTAFTL